MGNGAGYWHLTVRLHLTSNHLSPAQLLQVYCKADICSWLHRHSPFIHRVTEKIITLCCFQPSSVFSKACLTLLSSIHCQTYDPCLISLAFLWTWWGTIWVFYLSGFPCRVCPRASHKSGQRISYCLNLCVTPGKFLASTFALAHHALLEEPVPRIHISQQGYILWPL